MPMYFARTIEEKYLVGVFNASGTPQLFDVIDEVLDPFECEFMELPYGSGLFLDGTVMAGGEGEDEAEDEAAAEGESADGGDVGAAADDATDGGPFVESMVEIMLEPSDSPVSVSEAMCSALQNRGAWKQFSNRDYEVAYGVR